jgi:hypothetical protein
MSNNAEPEPKPQSETEAGTSGITLTLSSKGLENIIWSNYENDFEFEICGEHYFCPSFVAEFLSADVSKVRRSDRTIQKLDISIEIHRIVSHNFFRLDLVFQFVSKVKIIQMFDRSVWNLKMLNYMNDFQQFSMKV